MLELNGHINDNGEAKIFNRKNLDKWFRDNKGKDFVIKVERKKKKRSNSQNSFMWGVIVPIVRQGLLGTGNEVSLEQTHDFLKLNFNYKELINTETGEVKQLPLSTANLTTVEFMEYLERIARWCAEYLGIVLPEPNQQLTIYET